MVEQELSADEQHIAASTSYAYWAYDQYLRTESATTTTMNAGNTSDAHDRVELRIRMAMREAYRQYVGQNHQYRPAVTRWKQTLQWRKETRIDLLKLAFSATSSTTTDTTLERSDATLATSSGTTSTTPSTGTMISLSDTESTLLRQYEQWIQSDLHIQTMGVRGFDRHGRPIIVRQSRQQPWQSSRSTENNSSDSCRDEDLFTNVDMDQSFEWSQLYMAERALAITEWHSGGRCHHISAFFDYTTYNSKNAPPVSVLVRLLVQVLQHHYPERLGRAVFVHAPFWMTALMTMINPLIATKTREKLVLVGPSSTTTTSSSVSSWIPSTVNNFFWRTTAVSASSVVETIAKDTFDDATIVQDENTSDDGTTPSSLVSQSDATIQTIVDADQAMVFMRSDGKFHSPIDIMYQLYQVPFYEIYDYQRFGTEADA